jgi:hypothetical protein
LLLLPHGGLAAQAVQCFFSFADLEAQHPCRLSDTMCNVSAPAAAAVAVWRFGCASCAALRERCRSEACTVP